MALPGLLLALAALVPALAPWLVLRRERRLWRDREAERAFMRANPHFVEQARTFARAVSAVGMSSEEAVSAFRKSIVDGGEEDPVYRSEV